MMNCKGRGRKWPWPHISYCL